MEKMVTEGKNLEEKATRCMCLVWCDVRSEGGVRCVTETNEVSIHRNIRPYEFDEEFYLIIKKVKEKKNCDYQR
jgi:hypothetical protein